MQIKCVFFGFYFIYLFIFLINWCWLVFGYLKRTPYTELTISHLSIAQLFKVSNGCLWMCLSVFKFESNLLIGLSKYCLGSQQKENMLLSFILLANFLKHTICFTIRENSTILYFMGRNKRRKTHATVTDIWQLNAQHRNPTYIWKEGQGEGETPEDGCGVSQWHFTCLELTPLTGGPQQILKQHAVNSNSKMFSCKQFQRGNKLQLLSDITVSRKMRMQNILCVN